MRPLTLEDLYQQYRNRPVVIRDAIMRTNSHPTIINLVTRATLRVLTRLVSRADKSDGMAPLKARVGVLAQEAECDEKTVRRAIAALVELGWLALPSISRNEYGIFTSREYHFTQAFCELVNLPCSTAQEPEVNAIGTEMSGGAVYVDLSFKKDQREIEKENRKAKNLDVELPKALEDAAEEFDMNRTGVAQLRGLAHRAGYLLEDVIEVGREYLRKANATKNRAHRYLLAMIQKPCDYATRAAQLRRLGQDSKAEKVEVDRMTEAYRGKVFESPDLRELVSVSADGKTALHRLSGIDKTIPLHTLLDVRYLVERVKIGQLAERKAGRASDHAQETTGRSEVARQVLATALQLVRSRRGPQLQAG